MKRLLIFLCLFKCDLFGLTNSPADSLHPVKVISHRYSTSDQYIDTSSIKIQYSGRYFRLFDLDSDSEELNSNLQCFCFANSSIYHKYFANDLIDSLLVTDPNDSNCTNTCFVDIFEVHDPEKRSCAKFLKDTLINQKPCHLIVSEYFDISGFHRQTLILDSISLFPIYIKWDFYVKNKEIKNRVEYIFTH